MRLLLPLLTLASAGCATTAPVAPATTANLAPATTANVAPATATSSRAAAWWGHVERLSADAMEGRAAGTPGHQRAVDYVTAELARLGLEPAGTQGFLQPAAFTEHRIDLLRSQLALMNGADRQPIDMPEQAIPSARSGPPPATVDGAPLVFIGYGLHMPQAGHDDLAGVDLRGRIAVFVSGGPANLSGAGKSHARAQRARLLAERGALGAIAITTPGQLEAPWASAVRNADSPSLYPADAALRDLPTPFLTLSWSPIEGELLFAGSGRTWTEVAAAADASAPLATLRLRPTLHGRFAGATAAVTSPNIVARLPGSDPRLAAEHVVLSAHIDGLGVGRPVNGDAIYNGALDNASGVAALLDIAGELRARRPRRSILFTFVTAEERGLLGSRFFIRRPSVPRQSIVANLNYDMALPLFALRSVIVLGAEESSVGADARAVGVEMDLPLTPDPFPNRNSFIRSDQYAFIEQGVPSVAFKFGFTAGTPEAEAERAFRADRYHTPSDDVTIPAYREDEIRLHDFIAALALRVANADARPAWNADSVFRRPR